MSEFDSNSNVREEGMNNELLNKARPMIGFIMNDIDLKYCKLLLFSKDCSCTTNREINFKYREKMLVKLKMLHHCVF